MLRSDRVNIKELVKDAHENAKDKGWHDEDRTFGELIALCHAELSEALEEFRKGKRLTEGYYKCEGDYSKCNAKCSECKTAKPEGIPIELADVIIRIADMCGKYGIDAEEIDLEKVELGEIPTFGDFIAAMHYSLSHSYFVGESMIRTGCVGLLTTITLIECYCKDNGIDLDEAIKIKMEYNKSRSHKHGGKVL